MRGAPERSHALTDSRMCNPRVWARTGPYWVHDQAKTGNQSQCGGFMLVVEKVSIAHHLFKSMLRLSYTLEELQKRRVVSVSANGGSVNLRVQRFLLDQVCVLARSGMV